MSINDASPGEWSVAHKKSMEDTLEEPQSYVNEAGAEPKWQQYQDERDSKEALGTQVGGDWYKNMTIQPLEFILANDLGFCEGNAIKYICRHESKGGSLDIDKAIHYLEMLKEDCYG